MKHQLHTLAITLLLGLGCLGTAFAQQAKPKAFDNYAAEISCNTPTLHALISAPTGSTINVTLGANFTITGTVKANLQKTDNLKTVLIQLTNFPSMLFSLSIFSDSYNTNRLVGRILSTDYADAYEIQLQPTGNYNLVKQVTNNIIQPCMQ